MIIDAHVHTFPEEIAETAIKKLIENSGNNVKPYTDGTLSGLLKSMEIAGIDVSVNLPIATKPAQTESIIDYSVKSSKKYKNIIFFASVHPLNQPSYIDEVFKKIKGEGIKGIKLHPQYQNFPVDSEEVFHIYEKSIDYDIVIHFHSGFDIGFPLSDYASATRFKNVLEKFKGLKIILAHGGGYKEWEKVEPLLLYDNVYLDTSFTLDSLLEGDKTLFKLYEKYTDRLIFGTDSPWQDQKEDVEKLNKTFLSDSKKELIFYKNYKKLLII
ncbi:MAG TPA: amidohydrolase family protein [Spirochaetota bacterium]|nr:amidohydrolase family protein [Spirochaetota bacterium]HOM38180.1 amidohydrolase family protein [Spirochaetota bacterium]HPQ48602.1 amidohydrolase family protein [Spirochaetota bacterium]